MKEVVIMVGRQGSGKTEYCRTKLPGHVRVSQDDGPRRFATLFVRYRDVLDGGAELIVVDRTNPRRDQRAAFATAAREFGCRVRIIHLDVPRAVCEQRIVARPVHPTLTPGKMREAINQYESLLEPPTPDECDELVVIRHPQNDSPPAAGTVE